MGCYDKKTLGVDTGVFPRPLRWKDSEYEFLCGKNYLSLFIKYDRPLSFSPIVCLKNKNNEDLI